MAIVSPQLKRVFRAPSWLEVTCGVLLGLMLGGGLAAGYLVGQTVETVQVLPREPVPGRVYYVTGSARRSLGKQWLRKKQVLTETAPAEIRLTEDELNTWFALSRAKPDADAETGIFAATNINFRVHDDTLQIGLPCELKVFGFHRKIIVQTTGGFVSEDGRFVYAPDRVMIGGLAAHRLPPVSGLALRFLRAAQETPEEITAAWNSLTAVTIEGDTLLLARR